MTKTEREINLEQALITLVGYADETSELWDAGNNDAKIGKRLIALSGRLPGYDAGLDKVHEVVKSCSPDYYWCDNCNWKTGDPDRVRPLCEAKDLHERLDANCPVPFGICPMCDCFVYREDSHSRLIDAAGDMAKYLRHLNAAVESGGEELEDSLTEDLVQLIRRIGDE